MKCDSARELLSAALDGELSAGDAEAAQAHVQLCASCAAYDVHLLSSRRRLRLSPLGDVPDIAPRVMAALDGDSGRRRRWTGRTWRPVAAAFVAGAVAGGVLMGLGRSRPDAVVAADLGQRVLHAQTQVSTLDASVTITERGWNPAIPVRRFTGTLRYRAPESLALVLRDLTSYPSPAWLPNDTTLVIDGNRSWSEGRPGCPLVRQPGCEPVQPQRIATEERPPFADEGGGPLDLVVPVATFSLPGSATDLPVRTIDGRLALGVTITVAQLQPLLDGLEATGNWRELYPADSAEVWLDRATMVPLRIVVRAGAGVDRERWAAARGYTDDPDAEELDVTVRPNSVNGGLPADAFPDAPGEAVTRVAGFVDQPVAAGAVPTPSVPLGFTPARSGVQTGGGPSVSIRTWTDGRSWLEVAATQSWSGPGLFGDLGPDVRTATVPGGVAYVDAAGGKVAIHGAGIDVVVRGTIGEDALVAAAASLGVTPVALPADWRQDMPATLSGAAAVRPGLLVPRGLNGFRAPAIAVSSATVTLDYTGAGDRSFRLVETAGSSLTPPLDPDARGVLVRGVAGRYQPQLHDLEWSEGDLQLTLHSATLTAAELLSIAASLGSP